MLTSSGQKDLIATSPELPVANAHKLWDHQHASSASSISLSRVVKCAVPDICGLETGCLISFCGTNDHNRDPYLQQNIEHTICRSETTETTVEQQLAM